MPLFNNRRGNGGTGRGFLTQFGHRREAVAELKDAARFRGAVHSPGNNTGGGPVSSMSALNSRLAVGNDVKRQSANRYFAAADKARAAGVSERKITKLSTKHGETGFKSNTRNPFARNPFA